MLPTRALSKERPSTILFFLCPILIVATGVRKSTKSLVYKHLRISLDNLQHLTPSDQVKFVVGDRQDFDFAKSTIGRLASDFPMHHVLFSPVNEKMPYHVLAEWILKDKLPVRFHTQLHKTIWPDADRGK